MAEERPPEILVGGDGEEGLLGEVEIGDVATLEAAQLGGPLAATAIAVHEVGAEGGGVEAQTAVEDDVAHEGREDEDVVDIMIDAVEGVLVDGSRL